MSNESKIVKNRYGYFELADKPSQEELKAYYADKYYQNGHGAYQEEYSEEEIKYITNKLEQKYNIVKSLISGAYFNNGRFLDIGAGQGWALSFFNSKGWKSTGLDYSDHGCNRHNPGMVQHLIVGDIYDSIDNLIDRKERYELVQLDNVLEHVLDPLELLEKVRTIISENGTLIIEVPNDFSYLQEQLLARGHITKRFWISIPDHISYFNKEGLTSLCTEAGWVVKTSIGDFPIDFNLFNPATNYVKDESVGKTCHTAHIEIENLLYEISPDKTNSLYHAFGELGVGRQIIAFVQSDQVTIGTT